MKLSLICMGVVALVQSTIAYEVPSFRGAVNLADVKDDVAAVAVYNGKSGKSTKTKVVDLSKDFEIDEAAVRSSPGSRAVKKFALEEDPTIYSALVLEGGKVVASYLRDGTESTDIFQSWSATKGLITLAIGMLVDEGKLTVETTLGEIWEDPLVWEGINEAEFRKSVTILELITMTSGLAFDRERAFKNVNMPDDPTPEEYEEAIIDGSLKTWEINLNEALSFPIVNEENKGTYDYILLNNILSYVILELSGVTPRQYYAEKVFPHLGIDDSEIDWTQNTEGVETAFSGLFLNTNQLAKFGQLYLQGGDAGEGTQVVSQGWIEDSLSLFVDASAVQGPGTIGGYLWFTGSTSDFSIYPAGVWCAVGGPVSRVLCLNSSTGRVLAFQRDFGVDGKPFEFLQLCMDPELSFRGH